MRNLRPIWREDKQLTTPTALENTAQGVLGARNRCSAVLRSHWPLEIAARGVPRSHLALEITARARFDARRKNGDAVNFRRNHGYETNIYQTT